MFSIKEIINKDSNRRYRLKKLDRPYLILNNGDKFWGEGCNKRGREGGKPSGVINSSEGVSFIFYLNGAVVCKICFYKGIRYIF